jgi:hypothetical protein
MILQTHSKRDSKIFLSCDMNIQLALNVCFENLNTARQFRLTVDNFLDKFVIFSTKVP